MRPGLGSGSALVLAGLMACGGVGAADLHSAHNASSRLIFSPTAPDGVASDLPRSPLQDFVSNSLVRFDNAADALQHCRRDVVVWVSFGSNHYRRLAQRPAHEVGAFMCQADASEEGDRP